MPQNQNCLEVYMMRILVGYNGSEASKAALTELRYAGLPSATHILVLSVSELWVHPQSPAEAMGTALEAKHHLNSEFPEWSVYTETASGSPEREILARAETYKPDLIVLGEPHAEMEKRNVLLGQTSRTVLTEAECPVRIARASIANTARPPRILVGFDGSNGSMNAVKGIVAKNWDVKPQVRLLMVTDLGVLSSIDRPLTRPATKTVDLTFATQWVETIAEKALQFLRDAGVSASLETRLGNAKEAIIADALSWDADTIYVGPHCSGRSFDRFLLGSVSAAVAARAHCSVEVVRAVQY
jgi:nucleotide-binding universal stress UspA family protein